MKPMESKADRRLREEKHLNKPKRNRSCKHDQADFLARKGKRRNWKQAYQAEEWDW